MKEFLGAFLFMALMVLVGAIAYKYLLAGPYLSPLIGMVGGMVIVFLLYKHVFDKRNKDIYRWK